MTVTFREREFKGSRLRCLLLTSQTHERAAEFISSLVAGHASVTPHDRWAPCGFIQPEEAKLGETPGFILNAEKREALTSWWLAIPGRANTPNWDIVSTCTVNNKPGLILVEAKAHEGEFAEDCCEASNPQNMAQIGQALAEASNAWNQLTPGFSFNANAHYQLSNRFAFAWKLAAMGIPVVLVYLGFLNAEEMGVRGRVLLANHEHWRNRVVEGLSLIHI